LLFGDEEEFKDLIDKAELLNPGEKYLPAVYYLNLPKKFIAGTVYDPIKEEIIKGARCEISGAGTKASVVTDGFGDFWFKDLPDGIYDIAITAEGYAEMRFASVDVTGKDKNLGDIPLSYN
jgi:hypothetical protein